MPDVGTHYLFGQQVRAALGAGFAQCVSDMPFTVALYGPDLWFLYEPWKHETGRGRVMHTRETGAFLMAVAAEAKRAFGTEAGSQLFSYCAGFLCHYALDSETHPYIIEKTTGPDVRPNAHRAFEHSLDLKLLEKRGCWTGKHPVTEPALALKGLPKEMDEGLNSAYKAVYGWEHARRSLNVSFRRFRFVYRLMDKRGGLAVFLAKRIKSDFLDASAYGESRYDGDDVENLAHMEWHHAFAPELISRADFGEQMKAAEERAVKMIRALKEYTEGRIPEGELAGIIGNRSYLSGLDMGDPRNESVPSMAPSPWEKPAVQA